MNWMRWKHAKKKTVNEEEKNEEEK